MLHHLYFLIESEGNPAVPGQKIQVDICNNLAAYCRSAIVVMETNVCMYPEYNVD